MRQIQQLKNMLKLERINRIRTTLILLPVMVHSQTVMAQSNDQGLVGLVKRLTSLTNEAKILVEAVFFLVGIALAGYGMAKFFGVWEPRPGEGKLKFIMAALGGGALIGLGAVVEMSRVTIVNA